MDAVTAETWAHAVGFAAVVEFVVVGAPDTVKTEMTKKHHIMLLTAEDSSAVLDLFGPIFKIEQFGRQTDLQCAHFIVASWQNFVILSLRRARGSQGELLHASAKQIKVIIKRDLKLEISSWRVQILVPWPECSPNIKKHGDSWHRAFWLWAD
jgi:hypothetical protein